MRFGERIAHAWNAFLNINRTDPHSYDLGSSYSMRPDRTRPYYASERSLISAIYTRVAIDVTAIGLRHVRLDKNKQYIEDVPSGLNECLTVEANKDQAASAFMQDVLESLFDEGVIAVVPVDTTLNPAVSGSFDIKTMRVGRIVGWYPSHVRVELYNDQRGMREQLVVEKQYTAIVENPLYSVMNEPNSTLKRLTRKIALLDAADETASGKLDLIIQLPYTIRSESRRAQAEQRRKDIEFQLSGSKYGIAYADGTEKIVQLNRAVENTLLEQVDKLTAQLFAQLGLTEAVMNGTADERAMINYYNRTVEPILRAITEAYRRAFLTKTARSQGQTVAFFRNVFGLVPVADLAEITDKFTRNEVLTANEVRGIIGIKPSNDPKADELRNSNMPQPAENQPVEVKEQVGQNGS